MVTFLILMTCLLATSPSFILNQSTTALQKNKIKKNKFKKEGFFSMFRKERYHHKHPLVYVRSREDEEFVVVTKH